jgi:arylsulfatase A-like enzyme
MSGSFDRRAFLKATTMLTIGAYTSKIFGFNSNSKKPNLLFIWTDQQRYDTMAVYGNKKIKMPNLNKFAEESIVFKNNYVTQPVCTPSRGCVMTGLWPHQTGLLENNISLSASTKCFPEIINDPDYSSGYFGKWHLGDEFFPQHGFREWVSIEDQDVYIKQFSAGRDRSTRSTYNSFLIQKGYKPDDRKSFSRSFVSKLPYEHSKTKFLEMRTCDFLERHQNNPFMLYVNFLEPHTPHNGPFNNMYKPDELDLSSNVDCELTEDDPLRYRKKAESDKRKIKEDWKTINAKYSALCTQVDMAVGGILGKLESLGLKEDTIVVYTSDHGEMMGSHGLYNKTVMYKESVKVPWLIRYPGFSKKQIIVEQNVSHVDLTPTLLDLMGKRKPEELPGKSLLPLIEGKVKNNGDVFIEWNPVSSGNDEEDKPKKTKEINEYNKSSIRTIISQDGWKLCMSDFDKSQLFNLNNDPDECNNLFYTGKYDEIIEKLRGRIHQWQKHVKDKVAV